MFKTQRIVARLLILAFFAFGFKPTCLAKCSQNKTISATPSTTNEQAPCHGESQKLPQDGNSKNQRSNHCQLLASVCCFPVLTEDQKFYVSETTLALLMPLTTDVVGSLNPFLPFEPPKAS